MRHHSDLLLADAPARAPHEPRQPKGGKGDKGRQRSPVGGKSGKGDRRQQELARPSTAGSGMPFYKLLLNEVVLGHRYLSSPAQSIKVERLKV